jgi:hypothetical protein
VEKGERIVGVNNIGVIDFGQTNFSSPSSTPTPTPTTTPPPATFPEVPVGPTPPPLSHPDWLRVVAETNRDYDAAMAAGNHAAAQDAVARRQAAERAHAAEIARVSNAPTSDSPAPWSYGPITRSPGSPPAPPPPPPPPVKIPNRDVVNFSRNEISAAGIATLLFENVGGIEISTLTRRDTVEGQNPYYTLISNLANIKKQYDPTKLISKQKPNQTFFDIFPIDLNSKIPGETYLRRKNLDNFFYIASNGDFVIELDNIFEDENIQLEIAGSGTIKMVNGS